MQTLSKFTAGSHQTALQMTQVHLCAPLDRPLCSLVVDRLLLRQYRLEKDFRFFSQTPRVRKVRKTGNFRTCKPWS